MTVPSTNIPLSMILDSSPIATAVVTLEGRVLYTNRAVMDIVGYSTSELNDLGAQVLIGTGDALRQLTVAESRTMELERPLPRKSRDAIWASIHIAAIDAADPPAFVVQLQDIASR